MNQDKVVTSFGRRLLLFCQMTDLFIANGRRGDAQSTSLFTFASHNGLSVVDYLLCSVADSHIGTRRKICIFIHIIKCQSNNYNSFKFQVDRLRNKKVTIRRSALSYNQEGASLRRFDFMLVDGNDKIGYFLWKFQSRALVTYM